MPFWLVAVINLLIQYGGPLVLGYAKKWLEVKYPQFAAEIEKLINNLKNPNVSDSMARKQAMECIGVACQSDLKE